MKNKNQDTSTLWGVQDKATSAVFRVYLTRKEARRYGVSRYHKPVKLECRIVDQKKPRKPKTFIAHGLEWIPHTPGDPMPCEANTEVCILFRCGQSSKGISDRWSWRKFPFESASSEIIGWNYADFHCKTPPHFNSSSSPSSYWPCSPASPPAT